MNSATRRTFLRAAGAGASLPLTAQPARRPNVILIISDDQGYGDLSLHGNPHLQTPSLDRIAKEGVQFTQFHVNPVCSPTRASLMTGRYYYRTGIVDTYLGRSMMYPDEVTLAEVLRGAGYRTGIFGKWHLGDNYPMRATEQGFEEALTNNGGGLMQPSDYPGNRYTDPYLRHNGVWKKYQGYCTDVFTTAALEWIEQNRSQPFFAYVPYNAPHDPLEIDERYAAPFRKAGLNDRDARVYGMVANIDENVGRVLDKLDELKLAQDTIVIFLTDNGPQHDRFNGGMRGRKGTVYQGGIRVPFFLRWPRRAAAGGTVDRAAAHIDVAPTLAEICGAKMPTDRKIDGRSLKPLLDNPKAKWADRTLFFQWHRGDEPELFRACAARNQRYKMVDGKELYDLEADPAEKSDIAQQKPEILAKFRREYEAWFRDMGATRNGYAPPRIHLGAPQENPSTLTRQDWRGPMGGWNKESLGYWEVEVVSAGDYDVTLRMTAAEADGKAKFSLNGVSLEQPAPKGTERITFARTRLPAGRGRLEAELHAGGAVRGVQYVDVKRL